MAVWTWTLKDKTTEHISVLENSREPEDPYSTHVVIEIKSKENVESTKSKEFFGGGGDKEA